MNVIQSMQDRIMRLGHRFTCPSWCDHHIDTDPGPRDPASVFHVGAARTVTTVSDMVGMTTTHTVEPEHVVTDYDDGRPQDPPTVYVEVNNSSMPVEAALALAASLVQVVAEIRTDPTPARVRTRPSKVGSRQLTHSAA